MTEYIQAGKNLEKQYPEIIMPQFFHVLDENRTSMKRFALFDRFGPFALTSLIAATAGIILSLNAGVGLAYCPWLF